MPNQNIKTEARTVLRLYEKREKLKTQLRSVETEFVDTSRGFMDRFGNKVRCKDINIVDQAKKVLAGAK